MRVIGASALSSAVLQHTERSEEVGHTTSSSGLIIETDEILPGFSPESLYQTSAISISFGKPVDQSSAVIKCYLELHSPRKAKNAAAIKLLSDWIRNDPHIENDDSLELLKTELNKSRLSSRQLFPR